MKKMIAVIVILTILTSTIVIAPAPALVDAIANDGGGGAGPPVAPAAAGGGGAPPAGAPAPTPTPTSTSTLTHTIPGRPPPGTAAGTSPAAASTAPPGATYYAVFNTETGLFDAQRHDTPPGTSPGIRIPQAVYEGAERNGGIAGYDTNTDTFTFQQTGESDDHATMATRTQTTTTLTVSPDGTSVTASSVDQTTQHENRLVEGENWQDVARESRTQSTPPGGGQISAGERGGAIPYTSSTETVTWEQRDGQWGRHSSHETLMSGGQAVGSIVRDYTGTPIYMTDGDGNTVYIDNQAYAKLSPNEQEYVDGQLRSARLDVARNRNWGMFSGYQTFFSLRSLGFFIRAFDEYSGLRQYSSIGLEAYDKDVQRRKEHYQQEFCLALGVSNCITSQVCGTIPKIRADNVLSGVGPSGQFVSSGVINGERSIPVELAGMNRQQLIDLFGNYTVIKGRLINLTDPAFNPAVLGTIKLYLYHVQFSITDNVPIVEHGMRYNLAFKKANPGSTTSYGTPIVEAKWYPEDKQLEYGATGTDNLYKWSATEYTDVCLTFNPRLPSGTAAFAGGARLVSELCAPFIEYQGGPTEVLAPGQTATTPPSPTNVPGALI